MRNKFIIVASLVFIGGGLFAQDRIHVIGSRVIEAKVIEIGESDIIYKSFNNLNGPDYRLSTDRISFIEFENGSRQVFNKSGYRGASPYGGGYYGGYYDGYDGDYFPLDYRWGGYYRGDRRLRGQDLSDYIGYSLYGGEYMNATSRYYWGLTLTGVGVVTLISSIVGNIMENDFNHNPVVSGDPFFDNGSNNSAIYVVGYVAGAACLGAGIPLWVSGGSKLRSIADDYNKNYGRERLGYGSSVTVGPTVSGLGFALNF